MKRYQRGQALPLGLAMALVAMLGALVLYNTGRVATDKARLANAADAAAYSGLLWQARAMNFQAYTNRAMIANQVSIAQAVSISSWALYGKTTADNIARVLVGIPGVNAYAQGAAQAIGAVEGFVGPVAEAMSKVIALINVGVAKSQKAMFASAFVATPEIVRTIARASDERFDAETAYGVAGMVENLDGWNAFTEEYSPDDADDFEAMRSRAKLVNDSRDDFSRQRKWRLFKEFWVYSTPLTRHKIMREGETRLAYVKDADGTARWEWRAVDTVSLQTRIFRFARKEKKQEIPIGWGRAFANEGGSSSISERACRRRVGHEGAQCGRWTPNGTAESWARGPYESGIDGYRGLNAFRSLSEESLDLASGDPIITLRTEVALDASKLRSSGKFVDGEMLRADVVAPGDRLSSISAAEVFYRNPKGARDDALSNEAATGYNPYWDVRLAPVSVRDRLIATGLRATSGSVAPDGVGTLPDPRAYAESAALDAERGVAGAIGGMDGLPPGLDGGLPDYVSTLAGAYEGLGERIDVAALELPTDIDGAFDRFRIEDFVRIDGKPEDIVKNALKEQIAGAVDDIMRGRNPSIDAPITPEQLAAIDAGVEEARKFAEDLELARQKVAKRMDELGPELAAYMHRRSRRLDFEDRSLFRVFRGYDVPTLLTISGTFQQVSLEFAPDFPVPDRMAIEAAKVFYDEYREKLLEHGAEAFDVLAEEALEGIAIAEGLDGEAADGASGEGEDTEGDDAEGADGEDEAHPDFYDEETQPWQAGDEDCFEEWGGVGDCDGMLDSDVDYDDLDKEAEGDDGDDDER